MNCLKKKTMSQSLSMNQLMKNYNVNDNISLYDKENQEMENVPIQKYIHTY